MKFFKTISVVIVMFSLVMFMPQKCMADERVKLDITYGIEGKFKGVNLPINVEVENTTGGNLEGAVEVRAQVAYDYYDSYVVEVNLAANEKRTVTIPVNLSGEISSLNVLFTEGEAVLSEEKITIGSGRVNDYAVFMGILTDDYNGNLLKDINISEENNFLNQIPVNSSYKILNSVSTYKNFKPDDIKNVALTKEVISNNNNISTLDVIVINNYNISNLTENEYSSLKSWMDKGGTLIIGTGENAAKTIGSINKDFFNISSKGTQDSNGYTLADLSFEGEPQVLKDEKPIIYKKKFGLGNLYAVAYDFGNSNIAADEELQQYWSEALSHDFDEKFASISGNDEDYNKMELVNQIPATNMYSTSTLAVIFLIYSLFVGIILYFIFKKLKKREYLWVAIPITAVLFSVIFFVMGIKTRINDVVLNQVTFIEKESDGTSNNIVYAGITSKYNKDLLIKEPEEGNLSLVNLDEYYYGSSNVQENKKSKVRTKILYSGSKTSYEYKDISPLSMKTFKINNVNKTLRDIETDLSYRNGELKGTVKNTLGHDIKGLLVFAQNKVWYYGEIKAGEEVDIEKREKKEIDANQYDYINSSKTDGRVRSIVYSLQEQVYGNNGVRIAAITEIPMDYKFDFGDRKVSKFDTTVIVQNGNLNIADENGNCSLPFGYFNSKIMSSSDDVYVDGNMINGTGSLYLECSIDSNIDVNKLTIGYIKNEQNYQEEFKGKLYIFNIAKNDFEQIDYLENGVVLENGKDYLTKENTVQIYVECNEEVNVSLPEIAVEGVLVNAEN